jgi:hypothetical protein
MFFIAKITTKVGRIRRLSTYAITAESAEQALDALRETLTPRRPENVSVALCSFPETKQVLRIDDPAAGFHEPYGLWDLPVVN